MEHVMKNRSQYCRRPIVLGLVTRSTRGAWGHFSDEVLMRDLPGLSAD